MRRCAALLLSAGALLAGAARPAHAQTAPELHRISFEGDKTFDEDLLRAAIVSNQSSCHLFIFICDKQYADAQDLRGDLVRIRLFYYQRGYRHVTVQLDTLRSGGNELNVRFRINEGEPVRIASLDVTAADSLPDDPAIRRAMRAALPIAVGQPFSLIDYETARDTLDSRFNNLGFARAEVLANYTIPRDTPNIAHISFELVPDQRVRFGAITVTGNQAVSAAVVKRMLTFQPGDFYSYSDLLSSQRNLFGLETFQHVEVRADVNATTDTIIPVAVQVNEGNLHRVRFGVGMSTAEYINAEGSWTTHNFAGGARRLELRGRVYNILGDVLRYISPPFEDTRRPYNNESGSLSLDFTQPWFFDPLNTLNVGAYIERRSLPDIFVRTARGAYVNFTRSLGVGQTFSFGYHPELTQLTAGGDLVFCVNLSVCGTDEIQVLRDPHWLSPLTASFVRDRSNSLLSPTSGYITRLDAEYAANFVGSDFAYSRLIAELTDYSQLARGVVLAARVRPGWARALGEPGQGLGLHPQKRFFGGGANSVRGFAQFRMGPKLLTANAADFLAQDTIPGHCSALEINAGSCDVAGILTDSLGHDRSGSFDVRPVGGEAILEGNVELRVPFFWNAWSAALFVDFGQVWKQAREVHPRDVVFTPGFGFRYFSAIGPVRVDIGYNPHPGERLEVVTTKVCVTNGDGSCTAPVAGEHYTSSQLKNTNELVSLGTVPWNFGKPWYDRFQLHFSIGQAF